MSEPEPIGASIESLRVECIGMALGQEQLTISQRLELAAHLVALMEHGAQLQPTGSGEAWPAIAPPAPPPRRETVAEAIKAAREDVCVPGPPPASEVVADAMAGRSNPGAFRIGNLPRWSNERKALMFSLMAGATAPWHGIGWAVMAEKLSALPGPGITGAQARDWWIKAGAAQFTRATQQEAAA
jgi:hypothetical protein